MNVPEALTERFPLLETLEDEWQPLASWALCAWLGFYALFLFQLARGSGILPMIDLVLLPIHEGGHLIFSIFGRMPMILGGTALQLFVPFALAVYFAFRRQIAGAAFCAFCMFEQFLPIATYMADARAQQLPLVTIGDPENVEHDWFAIFSWLGALQDDTRIAAFVRALGWLGMFAVVGWLAWRGWHSRQRPV